MFDYNLRRRTCVVIKTAGKSLNWICAPENVGINGIPRQNYIKRHVTAFSNQLYNPEPLQLKAVVFCDKTYFKVDENNNFRTQRMSYSS